MLCRGLYLIVLLIGSLILPTVVVYGTSADAETSQPQEDALDDEISIEAEDKIADQAASEILQEQEQVEEEKDTEIKASPDVDLTVLFTKPALGVRTTGAGVDLPAGEKTKILVGFVNKGSKTFKVGTIDAQFRYPQDYTFFLQNFSVAEFVREVEPGKEATFYYSFVSALQLAGRPFGLTIQMRYEDDNKQYLHSIFNDTVMVVELDDGFDTEAFFMYMFMVAVAILIFFGIYHLFSSYGRKKLMKRSGATSLMNAASNWSHSNKPLETGTGNSKDIDYDWIPKEHLDVFQKKQSPRQSPRERKTRRQESQGEE